MGDEVDAADGADTRFSCARASAERGEPLHGTASTVRRWVLVEQPGAWGVDAVEESDLPLDVARHLREAARAVAARLVLIRRTGGGQATRGRRVYVGATAAGERWLERVTVRDVDELVDLDLSGLADGSIGGRRVERPLYLVCTNGKHDPCCAEFGLPIARALQPLLDDRVWECSHIGGDRFAANVVVLPQGVYHGRVTVDTAATIVAAHDAGALHLDSYRGRTDQPFAVQAADDLVRRRLGYVGIDEVVVEGCQQVRTGVLEVRFTTPAGPVVAHLGVSASGPCQLTCHADREVPAPRYELLDLTVG